MGSIPASFQMSFLDQNLTGFLDPKRRSEYVGLFEAYLQQPAKLFGPSHHNRSEQQYLACTYELPFTVACKRMDSVSLPLYLRALVVEGFAFLIYR